MQEDELAVNCLPCSECHTLAPVNPRIAFFVWRVYKWVVGFVGLNKVFDGFDRLR